LIFHKANGTQPKVYRILKKTLTYASNRLHKFCDFSTANMKTILLSLILICFSLLGKSQKVDSIYFHLYTDSLKKGTHNYINVDGKLSNGKWMPLSAKEITFTSNYGEFEGNELILPLECKVEKINIKAILRSDPGIWKETIIWIKKKPDDERLPTTGEVLKQPATKNKTKGRNK
jgi:hypothetical protein